MPQEVQPESLEELAESLGEWGRSGKTIELGGRFTKRAMGGEIGESDVLLSTRRLNRVLAYEPKDLTISVEAGITFRELSDALASNNQMLPLDPPFSEQATLGGVVATNGSGPRRRRYGTVRDMLIGVKMVTLEGKTVQSGGMVVKNVTGLDMGKLLIGSFGTLACMATLNFKVFPRPAEVRTFALSLDSLETLLMLRRELTRGTLQPMALDLLNAAAVRRMGLDLPGLYLLVMEAGGNQAAIDRCQQEFEQLVQQHTQSQPLTLEGEQAEAVWRSIRDFTPTVLKIQPQACVLRVSATPSQIGAVFQVSEAGETQPAVVVRGGVAVAYIHCDSVEEAAACLGRLRDAGLKTVVEFSPAGAKRTLEQWTNPGPDLEIMRRVKQKFDPNNLLNPGRLFHQI